MKSQEMQTRLKRSTYKAFGRELDFDVYGL